MRVSRVFPKVLVYFSKVFMRVSRVFPKVLVYFSTVFPKVLVYFSFNQTGVFTVPGIFDP